MCVCLSQNFTPATPLRESFLFNFNPVLDNCNNLGQNKTYQVIQINPIISESTCLYVFHMIRTFPIMILSIHTNIPSMILPYFKTSESRNPSWCQQSWHRTWCPVKWKTTKNLMSSYSWINLLHSLPLRHKSLFGLAKARL